MSEAGPKLERLQKVLSQRGIASRREAERLISDGLVSVNGLVVRELGVKVDPGKDKIEVAAEASERQAGKRWVALHKPVGVVTTKGSGEGANVMSLLPTEFQGLHPVGRLDKESSGLLLLTDDGVLGYALVDPAKHVAKEYEVRTAEPLAESQLEKFRKGIRLDGELCRPAECRRLNEFRFRIVLKEGRNRQLRRMCTRVGLNVAALKRLRIGAVDLGSLPEGKWRALRAAELAGLREQAGLPASAVPAST